jgi:EmrB/QacA subfamily drug resistance transporter
MKTNHPLHPEQEHRLRGITLISVMTALFLTLLLEAMEQTVVSTALPRMVQELQGNDRYTWVVTAYLLASTAIIPVIGKFSDQFGRKGFLLGGIGLFLLGSACAGLAPTMNLLIASRLIQGLGAGIGIALVATVIGDLFTGPARAKAQSIFTAVYGIANLLGPTVGGWLTDRGPLLGSLVTEATRWRWVFYLNLPVGVLATLILVVALPSTRSSEGHTARASSALRRIDLPGAALAATATVCLLLALTWGSASQAGWAQPPVIGMGGLALLLFVLFGLVERTAFEPIIPFSLLSNRAFLSAAILSLIQGVILLALAIALPLLLQRVRGLSPTEAGIWMTPFSFALAVGAALAGMALSLMKRIRIIALIGTVLIALCAFLFMVIGETGSFFLLVIVMVLAGLGIGILFPLLTVTAQNALPQTQLGVGTAAVRYLGQLGTTLGVALIGAIFASPLTHANEHALPAALAQELAATALRHGFVAVAIFGLLAILAACFLKDISFQPEEKVDEKQMVSRTSE